MRGEILLCSLIALARGNMPAIDTRRPEDIDHVKKAQIESDQGRKLQGGFSASDGVIIGQLPCSPDSSAAVELDGESGNLRPSLQIEHGSTGARFCSVINKFYEGSIVLHCNNGVLTASIDQCVRRGCSTVLAVAVTVGNQGKSLSPSKSLSSGEKFWIPCSVVNTIYRGSIELSCDGGRLSGDPSDCEAQWSRYRDGEWTPRSSQQTLRLQDGSLLIISGLTSEGFGYSNEVWHRKADAEGRAFDVNDAITEIGEADDTSADPENVLWTQLVPPPWTPRHRAAATVLPSGEVMLVGGKGVHGFLNDVWMWREEPYEILLTDPTLVGHAPGGCAPYEELGALEISPYEAITRCALKEAPGVLGQKFFFGDPQRRSKTVNVDFRWAGDVADAGVSIRVIIQDMNGSEGAPSLCMFVVTFSLTRSYVKDCGKILFWLFCSFLVGVSINFWMSPAATARSSPLFLSFWIDPVAQSELVTKYGLQSLTLTTSRRKRHCSAHPKMAAALPSNCG